MINDVFRFAFIADPFLHIDCGGQTLKIAPLTQDVRREGADCNEFQDTAPIALGDPAHHPR